MVVINLYIPISTPLEPFLNSLALSFEILNPSHVPSNGNTLAVTGGRGAGAGRHGAWPWRHRGTLLLGRSHWQGLRMGWGCCASTWSNMCGGCDHQSLVRGCVPLAR